MDNIQPGMELGPYRIIEQIGQGGMATVYKAYHAAMDRYVAVKVLPRQLAESPEFIGRFRQEARTIANLEHPHILPVHDYGESDGVTYLVMRHLDEGALKARLGSGPLALSDVDRLFSQLADALDYAHGHGVIHRDLKPSNVLVDSRGNLFLTDFGIAKLMEGNAQFTNSGALIGTPAYMSPEQAQGQRVDPRCDIYSLGIILYEMVTGRVPFEAETPLAVVLKHINDPLPLPSSLRPGLPAGIERVIFKALAKNPDDRFASTSEFIAAWKKAFAEGETMQAPAPVTAEAGQAEALPVAIAPAIPAPAPPSDPPMKPVDRPRHSLRKRRLLGVPVWVLGILLVVGCFACLVLNGLARSGASGKATETGRASTQAAGLTGTPEGTEPAIGVEPSATGDPHWASWTAANTVYTLTAYQDLIFAGGTGGITVWDRTSGTLLRHFTTANGLPSSVVNQLFLDGKTQALWAATAGGVARYDGQTWTTYNTQDGLDSDYATAIIRAGEYILVGTSYSYDGGGLNLFDGTSWQPVKNFSSASPDVDPSRLAYHVTALLADPAGGVWVGTANGLGRFREQVGSRFTVENGLPSDSIRTLMLAADGTVWVGTDGGAARYNGERFESVEPLTGVPIYGIAQEADGSLWFSGGGGVFRFNPSNGDWQTFGQQTGSLPSYDSYGTARDADGALYFGSEAGLVKYDGQFSTWAVPNVPTQFAFGKILPAPDGTLWFVQEYGARVDSFDPIADGWQPFAGLACESCVPLAFDSAGTLWAGSDDGLWVIVDGDPTRYTTDHGLPSNRVTSAAIAPDGRVWLGTESGVTVFDGQSFSEVFNAENGGLPSDAIRSLLAASDGSIWVGTDQGVSRLTSEGQWEHFVNPGEPFPDYAPPVADIAEDAGGTIWIASGDGAYRFAGGQWQGYRPEDPGVALPSPDVRSVTVAPDGSVWFGTTGGAARFNGTEWAAFGLADGLIHPNVNDIFVDAANTTWFATSGGATRFVP